MKSTLNIYVALAALALFTILTILPAAAERGADGFLDRAESVLREEFQNFHGDVTSSHRWREWGLHRANGEETNVQEWLSSRWEETPIRLADGYAASLADWAAADLRESDWVETLDFGFQLPIEGRSGRLNVSAIGPLARGLWGGDGVLGWQFPLAAGSAEDGNTELSGNMGLFYRQVLGGSGLAGLNVFGDYQDEGSDGSFWRWSLGAEYRTAWADVFANRYFPSAESHRRLLSGGEAERIAYSAGGYDAEVRVHAPGSGWLEGFAEYSLWEGEHGDGDEEGFRYGFRFSPRTGGVADGFRLEADYDAEEGGLGGRFDYSWTLGEFRRIGGASAFDSRAHMLSPVERRHAQRVRARTQDLIVLSAVVGGSARGAGSASSLVAPCEPGDLPTSDEAANLIEAIDRGIEMGGVCRMILEGADVNLRNATNGTPLHRAVVHENHAAVSLLIKARADVNAQNNNGRTPLNLAAYNLRHNIPDSQTAQHNLYELFHALMRDGKADPNAPDMFGHTALDMIDAFEPGIAARRAFMSHLAEFIRGDGGICLVETGGRCGLIMHPSRSAVTIGINHSGAVHTVTAASSIRPGAAPIYSLVHGNGLSLTVDSETGVLSLPADSKVLTGGLVATASIQATTDGGTQSVTVEVVIEVSALPCAPGDLPTSDEAANLIEAIDRGIEMGGVCRMILEGADVNLRNATNGTPLHRAIVRGNHAAVYPLIKAGADASAQNSNGRTPLNLAVNNLRRKILLDDWHVGMIDTINWLLFYGKTDPNLPDIFGHTALDIGVAIYEDVEDGVISIANRHSPSVLNRIRAKIINPIRSHSGVCLVETGEQCGLVARSLHSTVTVSAHRSGAAVHTVAVTGRFSYYGYRGNYYGITTYSLVHSNGLSLTVNSKTGVLYLSADLPADSGILTEGLVATASIQAAASYGSQTVTMEVVIEISAIGGDNAGLFQPPDMFQNPPLQLIPSAGNQLNPPKLARARLPKIPESPAIASVDMDRRGSRPDAGV